MFLLYYLPITINNLGYIPVLACMLYVSLPLAKLLYTKKKKKAQSLVCLSIMNDTLV